MKTVLITGASGDLGTAIADLFLKNDFFIFFHGKNKKSDFSFCEKNPQKTQKIIADFSDFSAVEKMFSEISAVDVLINNAGAVFRDPKISPARFQKIFQINAIAPYFCAEFSAAKKCRSIVNIGSMRGFPESATTPDYSASKAALHLLTASLARKFAPKIRVNAVAPGFVATKMHAGNENRLKIEAQKTPLRRVATPAEIAEMVFFVAEKATFCTGEVFRADGGRHFSEK